MKHTLLSTPIRARAALALGVVSVVGALVAWADPRWLICSDVDDRSCNTCNDSCSQTINVCYWGQLDPCTGYVYDYQGNGTLDCHFIDKYCGTEGAGQHGTDCRAMNYYVSRYLYVSAGGPCPPCVRQYWYVDSFLIHDVETRGDSNCGGTGPTP